MAENRLPFNIQESHLFANSGKESEVHRMQVKDKTDNAKDVILKEHRSAEHAHEQQMQKLKSLYEFMKNDADFGKFVIDTHFVKAQRSAGKPARAYLVQKFIPGKRIDEMSNAEILKDKNLVSELLEFFNAAIIMLEKTKFDPERMPDFYADTKFFLGNFLHNPRYSGNILIADKESALPHRVYFVDSGTLFGPGHNRSLIKKMQQPLAHKIQLAQLRRWVNKLEQSLI